MLRAVTTLLGTFYLLYFDYPSGWQVSLSMTMLKNIVFGDKKVHPDVNGDVTKGLNELEKYCSGRKLNCCYRTYILFNIYIHFSHFSFIYLFQDFFPQNKIRRI